MIEDSKFASMWARKQDNQPILVYMFIKQRKSIAMVPICEKKKEKMKEKYQHRW